MLTRTGARAAPAALAVVFCLILVAAAAATLGCVPAAITDPETRKNYAAKEVALRVDELQRAAIRANQTLDPTTGQPLLDTPTTRQVNRACVDAARALKASPGGWYVTVRGIYDRLRLRLTTADRARLGPWLDTLDAALAAWGAAQ